MNQRKKKTKNKEEYKPELTKRRQLWLMVAFSVQFTSQKKHDEYYNKLINKLNYKELDFVIDFMKRRYNIK